MKKDETALGEQRDQSSGRKMEEDVGVTVFLLHTSGDRGFGKGILLLDELQSAGAERCAGESNHLKLECVVLIWLFYKCAPVSARSFPGPCWWPWVFPALPLGFMKRAFLSSSNSSSSNPPPEINSET